MIAKLIVWDESRERALARLAGALAEYRISGTVTNLPFLYNLATSPAFAEAKLSTNFIEQHSDALLQRPQHNRHPDLPLLAFALLAVRNGEQQPPSCLDPYSPWQLNSAWRANSANLHTVTLRYQDETFTAQLEADGEDFIVSVDGRSSRVAGALNNDILQVVVDGHRRRGTLARDGHAYTLFLDDGARHFEEQLPDTGEDDAADAGGNLRAPMNGTLVTLLVEPGAKVEEGTALLVMEAMKMEHTITAPANGTVNAFYFAPGDLVDGGAELVDFEPEEDSGQ